MFVRGSCQRSKTADKTSQSEILTAMRTFCNFCLSGGKLLSRSCFHSQLFPTANGSVVIIGIPKLIIDNEYQLSVSKPDVSRPVAAYYFGFRIGKSWRSSTEFS
jgi:hypothetical protein